MAVMACSSTSFLDLTGNNFLRIVGYFNAESAFLTAGGVSALALVCQFYHCELES